MKILITGCTDTHINKPTRAMTTKFMSIPELLCDVLTTMGHVVEHRAVTVGEDLEQFDRVMCFLYPFDRHARHPEGAIYTLAMRKDAIIGVDDATYENIKPTWKDIVPDLEAHIWFAPFFSWSDVNKLPLSAHTITYDPSPAMAAVKVEAWKQRIPAWIHAAFHRSSHEWILSRAKWQTLAYGSKELQQPRLLESTIIQLHGVAIGSAIPPYSHVGDGWWRVRVLHALWGGTVIGCDRKEFNGLDASLEHSISELEAMSPETLAKLAEQQHSVITKALGTMEELKRKITYALGL